MLQFLTYLLHQQIIEMRRSQNLRCPFLVPSWRLCLDTTLFMDDPLVCGRDSTDWVDFGETQLYEYNAGVQE